MLDELRGEHAEFAAGFERSVAERLRRARESAQQQPRAGGDLLRLQVADLVTRPPVAASPDLDLRAAATLMTRERVSALLVMADGRLLGIVTDRDLRTRCVAAGLESTAAVREVMTRDPHTLPRAASAFEALMTMSRLRIRHLPVVDEAGVHGMISTHDLLRAQSTNPLYVAERIGRCRSLDRLRGVVEEVRELHIAMVASNAAARQLGQAVTSVCDALTRRLIELEIERLGPPPVPCAWVAPGRLLATEGVGLLITVELPGSIGSGWLRSLRERRNSLRQVRAIAAPPERNAMIRKRLRRLARGLHRSRGRVT